MFESAKVSVSVKEYAVASVGFVNVLVTVISVFFCVPVLGRRPLLLWSLVTMAVGMTGAYFSSGIATKFQFGDGVGETSFMPYVAIMFVLVFICGFAPGPGNLTAVCIVQH